jgi:hypothetical protein
MTQYARPDDDYGSQGEWVKNGGSGSDLFQAIDESSVDDTDYIQLDMSMEDFSPAVFETSNVTDPSSSSGHKALTFRCKADEADGETSGGSILAKLLVGGSVVATNGTTEECPADGSWETFEWPLSTAQANAISSYSNLQISLTPSDPEGMMGNIYCSWLFFECPDAASAATTSPAFLLFVD